MNPRHYQKLEECPGRDSNPREAVENLLQDERLSPIALF